MTRIWPPEVSGEVTSGGRSGTVLAIYRISLSDCAMAPVAEETALMEDDTACAAAAGAPEVGTGSACDGTAGDREAWDATGCTSAPTVGKESSKRVPEPGWLATSISPPCSRTIP